jgi:hypothetical protein
VRPNPQSSCIPPRDSPDHRDTYLEQRHTEKLETEVRDVNIGYDPRKCMHAVQGGLLGGGGEGVIRALQSDINICNLPSLYFPTK